MKKLATLFSDSYRELLQVRTITLCAMFGALGIILEQFNFKAGSFKLGFSGLPNELVHFLFGPVVGGTFGGVMDILKFIIKPDGGFFFGYTLTAIAGGLIYGMFWYKKSLIRQKAFEPSKDFYGPSGGNPGVQPVYEYPVDFHDQRQGVHSPASGQGHKELYHVAHRFYPVFYSGRGFGKSRCI